MRLYALEPITFWIGGTPLNHGERAEEDPQNPEACLCGHPSYVECPDWLEYGMWEWEIATEGDA